MADREKSDTGFGKRLKELRLRAGLTLTELGDRIGMKNPGVARLESSAANPTWATILKLCEALSVTPDEFREGE